MPASPLAYAASLIKKRLRSAWEIDQALLRREVNDEERTEVVAKLTEAGLIDDRRFALAWLHTRDRLSPRGEWLLVQELQHRGVSEKDIQEALRVRKEEEDTESEFDRAKRIAERRARQYEGLPPETQARRMSAYLLRRGFSSDTVRRILGL